VYLSLSAIKSYQTGTKDAFKNQGVILH